MLRYANAVNKNPQISTRRVAVGKESRERHVREMASKPGMLLVVTFCPYRVRHVVLP